MYPLIDESPTFSQFQIHLVHRCYSMRRSEFRSGPPLLILAIQMLVAAIRPGLFFARQLWLGRETHHVDSVFVTYLNSPARNLLGLIGCFGELRCPPVRIFPHHSDVRKLDPLSIQQGASFPTKLKKYRGIRIPTTLAQEPTGAREFPKVWLCEGGSWFRTHQTACPP